MTFLQSLSKRRLGKPVNFGPEINSSYDDISPFLTKSGNILYFSSNRMEGLGGMDIFKAVFNTTKMNGHLFTI